MTITATPLFASRLEHCPRRKAEELQCVGRLVIYSYLNVTGNELTGWQMDTSGNAQPVFTPLSKKILPQCAIIPFQVDFSDTPTSSDEVQTCITPNGSWSSTSTQPKEYKESAVAGISVIRRFYRPGLPVISPHEQKGNKVVGKVTFSYLSSLFSVATGGAVTATGPNLMPLGSNVNHAININTGVAVGGYPYPLEVSYEIYYMSEGCGYTIIPSPDTGADAPAVHASGGD